MPETERDAVASVIQSVLFSEEVEDVKGNVGANVVDGLAKIAEALGYGLKWFEVSNDTTSMGVIEAHTAMMKEAVEEVSSGLRDVAQAGHEIAEALEDIARAINKHGKGD